MLKDTVPVRGRRTRNGPVLAEDGETFAGSTFVVEFDTLADAKAWAQADPYARAGLFETVEIRPFKWLLGGGKPD